MTETGRPAETLASARHLTEDELLGYIVRTIVRRLDPLRIVLFGSRARGEADEESDYDIMVEMETSLRPTQRAIVIEDLFARRDWSMDLLVYTPAEVRKWRDDIGALLYDIVREGRILYERP